MALLAARLHQRQDPISEMLHQAEVHEGRAKRHLQRTFLDGLGQVGGDDFAQTFDEFLLFLCSLCCGKDIGSRSCQYRARQECGGKAGLSRTHSRLVLYIERCRQEAACQQDEKEDRVMAAQRKTHLPPARARFSLLSGEGVSSSLLAFLAFLGDLTISSASSSNES